MDKGLAEAVAASVRARGTLLAGDVLAKTVTGLVGSGPAPFSFPRGHWLDWLSNGTVGNEPHGTSRRQKRVQYRLWVAAQGLVSAGGDRGAE